MIRVDIDLDGPPDRRDGEIDVLCAIPAVAGVVAWLLVRTTERRAPRLAGDVRGLLRESRSNEAMVIDHDTGQPLATTARSLDKLRDVVNIRTGAFPALAAALRAVTRVPGLVALAVLGALVVGAVGTVLLLGGLVG